MGGAPLSLLYTIKGLDRKKYDPEVLFIHEGGVIDLYKRNGIKTIVDKKIKDLGHTSVSSYSILNPLFWYRLFWQPISYYRFKKIIKKRRPDIVHLNTSSLFSCAKAAKSAGIKVVWHVREPLAGGFRRAWYKKMIERYSDAIIAICENDASKLIPSKKIHVVYNFVDFKQFKRSLRGTEYRKKFGLEGKKVVLMLGGISKLKGTHIFVKALKYVKKSVPDAVFMVAGPKSRRDITGSYEGGIHNFIEDNGLKDSVVFAGVVGDVPKMMAASDLVVFPSTKPHFGRPLIEGSAMGKPVIGSDLGGPKELVVNGRTGFLVKPESPGALAEAVIKILSDKKLAKKMGEAGYRFAKEKFEQKSNVRKITDIYEKLFQYKS